MSFPESARVIYTQNPLAEVTAELQFPTILKIDSGAPADFQDAIRNDYPGYRLVRANLSLPIPPAALQPAGLVLKNLTIQTGPIQHVFDNDDKKWQIILTRDKLSLKTTSYRRWEDFWARVSVFRNAFETIYRPAYYSRVSLRYVDIIRRSLLGLNGTPWSELLQPYIAGELSTPALADQIDSVTSQVHSKLDEDNCFLTLKTAVALAEPEKEQCFVIDSEFHTHKRTELADVERILNSFNRTGGRLFRWAIRETLHDALQPTPVD